LNRPVCTLNCPTRVSHFISAKTEVFDEVRVFATGILRALRKPLPAILLSVIIYWIFSLPVGLIGNGMNMGTVFPYPLLYQTFVGMKL
jgi:Na+-driven multidrug efflux pump